MSLETLKKVKKESFLNKNYFFNGVSKTNINNICRLLKHDGSPEPDICKDFNIKRELSKLPSRYLNNDLKEIVDFSYFYKKHVEIQDLHDKNIETYDCFANGGSRLNNYHFDMYNKVYDVFSMINRNFLAIDFLKEIKTIYRKSFEAIVFNFSINGNLNKKAWFKPQKFEHLDEFIFYIGVTSFDPRDLDVFLNKTLESKLIFLPEEINKIIIKNINNIYKNEYSYFENAIIILSNSRLNKFHIFKLIKLLTQALDEKKDLIPYSSIAIFLNKNMTFFKSSLESRVLLPMLEIILEKFINKFICGKPSKYDKLNLRGAMIDKITSILCFNEYKFKLIENKKAGLLIDIIDKKHKEKYKDFFIEMGLNI